MSTLLKTTSKAASNAKSKSKSLPRSDVRAAEQDMALEAGIAMSGEEDSEDDEEEDVEMIDDEEDEEVEEEDAAPVKKSKKVEKGKGKELKKKVVPETTTTVDKVDKAVQRRKDKVLMLSSRGITGRMRHLMLDLEAILPHLKKDAKLDSKSSLHLVNELADLHSCNNTLYFEARRHEDLYLWLSRSPNGPSVKCHVQNIHTMDELKMTGNCLKGSRGLVCFDGGWEGGEEWKLLREMLTHTFSVPKSSRKLKPFIDHILSFSLLDNKIWFRNFQIVEKDPLQPSGPPVTSLVEIGPRFVLTPIRIFEGSFGGPTIFANPEFISPASARASFKRIQGQKYKQRKNTQNERDDRRTKQKDELEEDELAVGRVFA